MHIGGASQIGKHSTNINLGERQKNLYKFFFHRKNKPFAQTKFINIKTHRPSINLYSLGCNMVKIPPENGMAM